MKVRFQFADPEQVEVAITITMTVREWRVAGERLKHDSAASPSYPYAGLCNAIIEAIKASIEKAEIEVKTQ